MGKLLRLIMRIFITIFIMCIIIFCIRKILLIKHVDKLNKNELESWSWENENYVISRLLNEKYFDINNDYFPIVMMKNQNIPKKGLDEKRILVIGDSFIYGTGSNNINYTWWKQLEWRFREEQYTDVNVYGAGKYGWNTQEELTYILENDELLNKIDPDLVIIGYVSNDAEEHIELGVNLVKEDWELNPENSEIYKKDPLLYYELVDRLNALDYKEYDKLVEIGKKLGVQRWDVRALYIVKDERLEKYKKVLEDLKERMEFLGIPYLYAFTEIINHELINEANNIVYNTMNELNIPAYYEEYNPIDLLLPIGTYNPELLQVNPGDSHPGIIWTYDYSKKIYEKIKENYSFIFEGLKKGNINELEININDTMPFLDVTRVDDNIFEFEYPKYEETKQDDSNFLYYSIEKNYIKLNLEYPKNVKKIKITGDNLEYAEIYVNTIDEEYGFDMDEAYQKLTVCEYVKNDTYSVNKKITSVNIYAEFKDEKDRTLRIKFIE